MNEEELFCKLFPEYAVNGKPLSPYFDLFENGYEQAEKRIAELEQKLEQTEKDLADYQFNYPTIKELEKENAELDMKRKAERKIFQGIVEKKNDQLTKAKELLEKLLVHSKRYVWIADDNNKPIMQKEIAEAEQFLKDSGVEK